MSIAENRDGPIDTDPSMIASAVAALRYSATTAANDDETPPMTQARLRHTNRVNAMMDGATLLETIGAETAEVRRHNSDLQASNNRYLERARKAEATVSEINNPIWPAGAKFKLGDYIRKKSGSSWRGRVCGFYSTKLTPVGYAVENFFEPNSVQNYPETAFEPWNDANSTCACEEPPEPAAPRRFRHRKRGSTYELIGEAALSCTRPICEGATIVVYRRESDGALVATASDERGHGEATHDLIGFAMLQCANSINAGDSILAIYRCETDGKLWARPVAEFNDGRFEELTQAPPGAIANGGAANGW